MLYKFGHSYHNLQSRVTRTLLHAFLDPTKSLPQHYGAIQGLAALGTSVVRLLILPNLEPYLQLLEPEMRFEEQKNKMKRTEAWRVYGALQHAAGLCVYDRLKKFPRLLTLPTRSCLKRNGRVGTSLQPNKRKASMDNSMHQPPLKKMATGGAMGLMPVNSMSVDMHGPTGGFPNIVGSSMFGSSSVGISTMPRQLPKENTLGREMGGRTSKTSTVLAQAWREDMDGGQLLASLFELYGESMFRFTPKSELLLFL
ncbi:hypothetical protein Patl1_04093 [Pistacia atlantica]|uniref:Uncharacterized protein n=1 Tax=Pistacia atlantica TaxID=434234 RepID=A0ACC1BT71_9ROSI|nr:hypothetical protein Patl1_04093 [Pistacia atlantica]